MCLPKGFESTIKYVCNSKVQMPVELWAPKVVLNKVVEIWGIIQTVLVKEAVHHAPTPRFHDVLVFFGESRPEIL